MQAEYWSQSDLDTAQQQALPDCGLTCILNRIRVSISYNADGQHSVTRWIGWQWGWWVVGGGEGKERGWGGGGGAYFVRLESPHFPVRVSNFIVSIGCARLVQVVPSVSKESLVVKVVCVV